MHKGVNARVADKAKQIELIRELTQRTQAGGLNWEPSPQRGTYVASLPNRVIGISGVESPMSEAYHLRIFDALGNVQIEIGGSNWDVIKAPGDITLRDIRGPLVELYNAARAVAESGTRDDAIIEDVLSEIRQLPHGGLKAG